MVIEMFLEKIIPYIIGILEATGVIVLTVASGKALIKLIKSKFDLTRQDIKLEFSIGLSFALEFKLGAEILKTVTVRTLDEFYVLAAVAILRMLISFMIHWEVASIEKEDKVKKSETISTSEDETSE